VPKPANWKDEGKLVDYVTRAIDDLLDVNKDWDKLCAECGLERWPFYDETYVPKIITWEMLENEAVQAAEGGNYAPLAQPLDPKHPLNHPEAKPPIRASLAPSTYTLIADILSGRRKKPTHRPKLTEIERRAINPIHGAVDEVPAVERMLRVWYPDKTANQIYDRALSVVARRHNMKLETLAAHLKRSKGDRRRLPQAQGLKS
jgi:hypothetical protein